MFAQLTVAPLNFPLLVKPQQVNGLRDEVIQLEQRIQQLPKAK